jgi:hypothetical protein
MNNRHLFYSLPYPFPHPLQRIINEYINYKLVFEIELINKTENINRYLNMWFYYERILTLADNVFRLNDSLSNWGYEIHYNKGRFKHWFIGINVV